MAHRIAIIIPYFGDWPEWIEFFVESCRWNRKIDWLIFNDRPPPENRAPNVKHVRTTFEDYKALISHELGIRFDVPEPYKLCEVRPALPYVHRELLKGYDFTGFGDLDVIYGDIRAFYDDGLLDEYDLLSSHRTRVSGHLCLMRNSPEMVHAFESVRGWKQTFTRHDYMNFDERAFFNLLTRRPALFGKRKPAIKGLFREAYSTPGAAQDMRWFWKDGQLTNEYYPQHPFMYLHFMSWQSNRWFADQPGVAPGAQAPWKELDRIVQMDWRDAGKNGFMISQSGIQPLPLS